MYVIFNYLPSLLNQNGEPVKLALNLNLDFVNIIQIEIRYEVII